MQSQQFKIEGWQIQQPPAPLSHRHQLKPLQQIITKSKAIPRHLQIQQTKVNNENQDTASFASLKVNLKKCHTQEIYRNNSLNQIKQLAPNSQKLTSIMQNIKKPKSKKSNFLSLLQLKQLQFSVAQNKEEQPIYVLRHVKNMYPGGSPKNYNTVKFLQKKVQQKLQSNQKVKKQFKKRRCRTNLNSQQCLVMLPNFKQKSKNKFRSFFLHTINAIQDLKSLESVNSKKDEMKKDLSDNTNKFKKMIQKSNRRKKQIEQLFKTRPIFGKKQIQRRIVETNLTKILENQAKKVFVQRMGKNEFDDDILYCPWSYRQQRLAHHLKRKQYK